VRDLLVRFGHAFENHWLSSDTERGEYLPLMREAIPGQYGSNKGVDIFAIDHAGQLWIIEVSQPSRCCTLQGGW
jgi:hypothetical protein